MGCEGSPTSARTHQVTKEVTLNSDPRMKVSRRLVLLTGAVVILAILSLALGGWGFARLSGHVHALNQLVVVESNLVAMERAIADLELSGFLAAGGDLAESDAMTAAAMSRLEAFQQRDASNSVPGTRQTLEHVQTLVKKAAAANADVRSAIRNAQFPRGPQPLGVQHGLERLVATRRATDLSIQRLVDSIMEQSVEARSEQKWAQHLGGTAFISGGLLLSLGLALGVVLHRKVWTQHVELTDLNEDVQNKKEFLQSVLDSLDANICILKEDGVIVDVNRSWNEHRRQSSGRMANAGVDSNYFEVCSRVQGEDRKQAAQSVRAIKEIIEGGGEPYISEYASAAAEEELWFQIRATPLSTARFKGAVVAHLDVTERVKATQRLQEKTVEAEKLALVAKSTDNAVMILDAQYRVDWVNRAFVALTGEAEETVRGTDGRDFLRAHVADPKQIVALDEAFAYNGSADAELLLDKDGQVRVAETQLRSIRCDADPRGAKFIVVARDVTRRREAENERERMHQDLVDSYQQAGKAATSLGVLHNVGNGLNSINVSATLLGEQLRGSSTRSLPRAAEVLKEHEQDLAAFLTSHPQGKNFSKYMQQLAKSTESERAMCLAELEHLYKHLETVKRMVHVHHAYAKDSAKPAAVDVRDVLDDALATLSGSFERSNVDICQEYEAVPTLILQKEKLMHCLGNLLLNALHAIRAEAPKAPKLFMRVSRNHDAVVIALEDNGCGIASDQLAAIFDHGYSTREGGKGLGLPAARKAVEELGGTLTAVSSGPGAGACFTIELPCIAEGDDKCQKSLQLDAS